MNHANQILIGAAILLTLVLLILLSQWLAARQRERDRLELLKTARPLTPRRSHAHIEDSWPRADRHVNDLKNVQVRAPKPTIDREPRVHRTTGYHVSPETPIHSPHHPLNPMGVHSPVWNSPEPSDAELRRSCESRWDGGSGDSSRYDSSPSCSSPSDSSPSSPSD